jgi:hypothetical protein
VSAVPLLIEFAEKGIAIRVDGPELALSVPRGKLDADLVSRVRREKAEIICSLERVKAKAGPDWDEIADDPEQLKAFADMLVVEDMRQRGIAPDHYKATTVCRHCGAVPIWRGCEPQVMGCPWCFNRIKGLPIPGINE